MLHISLCPSSGYLTNAPPEDDRPVDLYFVREYEETFIKVNSWGGFESSDVERNSIRMCSDRTPVPDFVAEFEQELVRKPRLALDVCYFLDYSSMLTGQCRRKPFTMLSKIVYFWTNILGLSSRANHQRNQRPNTSLLDVPGNSG